jgi:hypothetical protein
MVLFQNFRVFFKNLNSHWFSSHDFRGAAIAAACREEGFAARSVPLLLALIETKERPSRYGVPRVPGPERSTRVERLEHCVMNYFVTVVTVNFEGRAVARATAYQ